jgi:hypothetical protein
VLPLFAASLALPISVCCLLEAVLYNGFTGCPFSSLRGAGNGAGGCDGFWGEVPGVAEPGNGGADITFGVASTTPGGGTWQCRQSGVQGHGCQQLW